MNRDQELRFGAGLDASVTQYKDDAPERVVRVYPYLANKIKEGKKWLDNNAIAITSIENIVKQDNNNLQFDEETNKYYFDAWFEEDFNNQTLTYASGDNIRLMKTPTINTHDFFVNIEEQVVFLSFNTPYSEISQDGSSNPLFIVNNVQVLKQDYDELEGDYVVDSNNYYSISTTNLKLIEQQYTNLDIQPKENFNLTNFDMNINGENKTGFNLRVNNKTLLDSVTIRGTDTLGRKQDFEVETNVPLTPIKMTPIVVRDKSITLYASWFDYDNAPPYFIANQFLSKKTIPQFFIDVLTKEDDNGNVIVPEEIEYNREVELISQLIGYSQAIKSNFRDFNRLDTSNQGDVGKLDPAQYIGSTLENREYIIGVEGRAPIEVLDGLYEQWKSDYPDRVDTEVYQIMKILINMLSKYIISSNATLGGINDFVEAVQPWYLDNRTSILFEDTGDFFKVNIDNLEFSINSKYFDYIGIEDEEELVLKLPNLNRNKSIKIDRKLSLNPLPDNVVEREVAVRPIDIQASTSSLDYVLYAPISSEEGWKALFLSVGQQLISGNTTIPQSDRYYQYDVTDLPAYLEADAARQLEVSEDIISFVNSGQEGTIYENSNFIVTTSMLERADDAGWLPGTDNSPPITSSTLTNDLLIRLFLQENPKYSPDEARLIISNNNYTYRNYTSQGTGNRIHEIYGEGQVDIPMTYRENYVVYVEGDILTLSFSDRYTEIKKDIWYNIIGQTLTTIPDVQENLDIPIWSKNVDIVDIEEIYITSLWGERLTLEFPIRTLDIDLINKDDESVSIQRIIFS